MADIGFANARGLRLGIIRQQYQAGNLTESEALELLSGPLTPGDDSTIVDDSAMLKASADEAVAWFRQLCVEGK
jgi:hypothetical protein